MGRPTVKTLPSSERRHPPKGRFGASPVRTALCAILLLPVLLAASGCGRRGSLEPPQAAATQPRPEVSGATASARQLPGSVGLGGGSAAPNQAAVASGDELSPTAVTNAGTDAPVETSRGAKRGYTIPKQPFILDPLL